MIQIPICPDTLPEVFDPSVLEDDKKWSSTRSGVGKLRPLMFNVSNGSMVAVLKVQGEGTVARHHHSSSVTAWTIDGAWGYREYDWVARAGSFVYEPPGHIHTLYVHPSEGRMLVLFHSHGPLAYVDEKDNLIGYDDVFIQLARYRQHCKEQGLSEEWLQSLIR